jgi:hypothetical protein
VWYRSSGFSALVMASYWLVDAPSTMNSAPLV